MVTRGGNGLQCGPHNTKYQDMIGQIVREKPRVGTNPGSVPGTIILVWKEDHNAVMYQGICQRGRGQLRSMATASGLKVVVRMRDGGAHGTIEEAVNSSEKGSSDDMEGAKKRRTTYGARREEIAKLETEAQALSQCVAETRRRREEQARKEVARALAENELLRLSVHQSSLRLARTRSLLASTLEQNPLFTYITLTSADAQDRLRILELTRTTQLNKATQYILERLRFQNLRRTTRQTDTVEAANGDFWFTQFDVTPFVGVQDVRTVNDQLMWFIRHQEFIVWESLGIESLLDDEGLDDVDEDVGDGRQRVTAQVRIVSTVEHGVVMEKNVAVFREFFPDGSDSLPVPHGIVVLESIDEDTRYPYESANRVRLDISCVMLVIEAPCGHNETSTVSLVRCSFQCLKKPQCRITEHRLQRLYELIPRWGDVLSSSVRDFVALHGLAGDNQTALQ